MTNREQLKKFFSADNDYIKLHTYELYNLLRNLHSDDVVGLAEHRRLVELIAGLRQVIEDNDRLHGENFNATLESLLSVGEDGLYSDPLRFLFELIQNVDDADYVVNSKRPCRTDSDSPDNDRGVLVLWA